jgi:hypothetical protein
MNRTLCSSKRSTPRVGLHAAVLLVASVLGAAFIGHVAAAARADEAQSCFLLHAWDGQWTASADSRSIYVKENGVVFRLDLEQPIPALQSPWAVLNTKGSSDAVCSPLDLHLAVSDRLGGIAVPLVRKLTRLTPAEVAALPKKLKPR